MTWREVRDDVEEVKRRTWRKAGGGKEEDESAESVQEDEGGKSSYGGKKGISATSGLSAFRPAWLLCAEGKAKGRRGRSRIKCGMTWREDDMEEGGSGGR